MHFWLFVAAILTLGLASFLRTPRPGGWGRASVFFACGLLLSVLAVRAVTSFAGIGRPTDYDAFVADAVQRAADDEAPIALFVGASFSRNALDDARLTRRFREMGYTHQAINLSLEGSSLQERQGNLMQFIRQSGRLPDVVFLGVGKEFDESSAYVFNVAKFSDRAIDQFTPEAAGWAALGLVGGACKGAVGCIKDTGLGVIHLGLNVLNVGLLSGGRELDALEASPSFDPKAEPRKEAAEELQPEKIIQGLTDAPDIAPARGPHWASSFRAEQRHILHSAGVRRIGYYLPPVIDPDIRAYTASLCLGELAEFACIAPVDPSLLEPLKREIWFDPKHLLVDGAWIYTDWLAREIDSRGALK